MKGLTDIAGIRVGHISDFEAITGCTAILCEEGRRRGGGYSRIGYRDARRSPRSIRAT